MRLIDRLVAIWRGPEAIHRLKGEMMAQSDELVARFDAALNELADDLRSLRDEVAGSDDAVSAKFAPLIERAEALGADPADPVPGDGQGPAGESTEPTA